MSKEAVEIKTEAEAAGLPERAECERREAGGTSEEQIQYGLELARATKSRESVGDTSLACGANSLKTKPRRLSSANDGGGGAAKRAVEDGSGRRIDAAGSQPNEQVCCHRFESPEAPSSTST